MLEAVVDCISLLNIDGKHPVNEVESWIADRVPVRRGIIESSCFDLLRERVRIFLGVQFVRERREAA
jgi:hypothetical protein